MKYSFEVSSEIVQCYQCPFRVMYDEWIAYCSCPGAADDNGVDSLDDKPEWCPLIELKE